MAWNEPGGNGNDPKDPWGSGNRNGGNGNKGGGDQGPPDLDEVMRKVQDQMRRIMGGKPSSGSRPPSGGINMALFVLVLAVVVIGWVAMGFYTLDQQERGVVLRFGRYHETVTPGLHWNPPMVDDVRKVNVTRVRSLDHSAQMLTEDENIVEVNMSVQYVVSDPNAFVLNVRDPESSLAQATESALRHVVGSSEMHSILTEGRDNLAQEVKARLQEYVNAYGTGLQISRVNIENAMAPKQVQSAFDDVIKAREDEQRVKNEAESYANGVIPEARGAAQRVLEEANAYHDEVIARSQGDAERFLKLMTQYQQAPAVTRERLYLDAMQEVYSNSAKVVVDSDQNGGNSMMYLPLDKLTEASQSTKSARQAASQSSQLSNTDIQQLTDAVIDQLRKRQATQSSREGR
ncbi:FtsH protease activity modulator HflK [Pokkaliibacter sp. CJK22405]|uniref:FtsH protease activity modulator HflK n=1 Tax=Pokkaliibacter sp. CJK22405 TaxID=3384615 RepID=UPI003984A409